jgi:hypothetical protein
MLKLLKLASIFLTTIIVSLSAQSSNKLVVDQKPEITEDEIHGKWVQKKHHIGGPESALAWGDRMFSSGIFKGRSYWSQYGNSGIIIWEGKYELKNNYLELSNVYVDGERRTEYDNLKWLFIRKNGVWVMVEIDCAFIDVDQIAVNYEKITEDIKNKDCWQK